MWNVRVRASKKTAAGSELHISGAEGLYNSRELPATVTACIKRVLEHPRGAPDTIVLTVEAVTQKPADVPLLPVKTLRCASPDKAHNIIAEILESKGIARRAATAALKVLTSLRVMRGASLITAKTGRRVEPDKERGIRVSRLGMEKAERKKLELALSRIRINTETVREALILASKTASCPDILGEVCISDDPDYTTGYVSGRGIGYVRIPNMKNRGDMYGGRVFFIRENADRDTVINYLEKEPVFLCNAPAPHG
ncbi:MAG TPA: 6-carboxyhexanoate--CoA ligase [Dissulfurispiraceae bacterium]|nr:6-carboxyhexanoate--CoA ligase [Dissulfurispiraceae bacterium]